MSPAKLYLNIINISYLRRGFGKDLTQLHELNMYVDAVTCAGLYDINGKILILPITGKGAYNITLSMSYLPSYIHKKIPFTISLSFSRTSSICEIHRKAL